VWCAPQCVGLCVVRYCDMKCCDMSISTVGYDMNTILVLLNLFSFSSREESAIFSFLVHENNTAWGCLLLGRCFLSRNFLVTRAWNVVIACLIDNFIA